MIAVDTNVLIYAVDVTEPIKSKLAEQLLHDLSARGESIVVPWQVAAEFLACLRRWISAGRISWTDADAYLSRFIGPLPLVFPSATVLQSSLSLSQRHSLSHWDSLLLAACIEAGVTQLYSEDLSSGTTYDGVLVTNPFPP